jgi:hypothetical protein
MSTLREAVEIVEGASYGDDFELDLMKAMKLLDKINQKFSNEKIDARTYSAMAQAKKELERVLKRL